MLDLVGYYKMNTGSGTSLADSSSNSNTGTLTNMTNAAWVDSSANCCGGSDFYNITNVSGNTKEDGTTATFKVALKATPAPPTPSDPSVSGSDFFDVTNIEFSHEHPQIVNNLKSPT